MVFPSLLVLDKKTEAAGLGTGSPGAAHNLLATRTPKPLDEKPA